MEKKIKELHALGFNDSEIAEKLKISCKLAFYYRKKLNLPANFTYSSRTIIDKEILEPLVLKNISDSEIASIVGVTKEGVYAARKRYNLKRRNLAINELINPTKEQIQILKGCLLGDGSLEKSINNINTRFSCEHGINQKEYCEWKYNKLNGIGAKISYNKRNTPDKRNGIYYESVSIRIGSNEYFNNWLYMLYTPKKEISPKFLEDFNEQALAVLFMDDGSKNGKTCDLCLCSFSEKSLQIFQNFVYEKWDLEFNIHKNKTLYLKQKSFNTFVNIILPYMHESMLYKLGL